MMMSGDSKIIFIVTHGDYSDYRIHGVFDDEELAEAFAEHYAVDHGPMFKKEKLDVERWELNPNVDQIREGIFFWNVWVEKNGDVVKCEKAVPWQHRQKTMVEVMQRSRDLDPWCQYFLPEGSREPRLKKRHLWCHQKVAQAFLLMPPFQHPLLRQIQHRPSQALKRGCFSAATLLPAYIGFVRGQSIGNLSEKLHKLLRDGESGWKLPNREEVGSKRGRLSCHCMHHLNIYHRVHQAVKN